MEATLLVDDVRVGSDCRESESARDDNFRGPKVLTIVDETHGEVSLRFRGAEAEDILGTLEESQVEGYFIFDESEGQNPLPYLTFRVPNSAQAAVLSELVDAIGDRLPKHVRVGLFRRLQALTLTPARLASAPLRTYQTPQSRNRSELELMHAAPMAALTGGGTTVRTRGEVLQNVLNPDVTPLNPTQRNIILAECASIDAELSADTRRALFGKAADLGLRVPANATKRQLCDEVTAHLALANVVNPLLQKPPRQSFSAAAIPRAGKRGLKQ